MIKIPHGHRVIEDKRGIVLVDASGEEVVIDRSRPIRVGWDNYSGNLVNIPLEGGQSTPETIGGALYLAAKYGLRIQSEGGEFSVRMLLG